MLNDPDIDDMTAKTAAGLQEMKPKILHDTQKTLPNIISAGGPC
jgi:hypothetical protein